MLNQRVAWASIQIYGARGTMGFQRRFQDFNGDSQISREISDKVYEISVSGGPPEAGSILGNM